MEGFAVRPEPDDPRLTRRVTVIDYEGRSVEIAVVIFFYSDLRTVEDEHPRLARKGSVEEDAA